MFGAADDSRYTDSVPEGAESRAIPTAEAMYELRASDWHEGSMSVLKHKSTPPVAAFNFEFPRVYGGLLVDVGDIVWKDAAGNFGVVKGGAKA